MFLLCGAARGEELVIALARGAGDPLVEFVPPPPGSSDSAVFTRQGLRIRQRADAQGPTYPVTGFKSPLTAQGEFEVALDLECLALEPPTDGWGQGLVFCVFLDDEDRTVLKLNRVAMPRMGQVLMVEIRRGQDQPPLFHSRRTTFNKGRLIIRREGKEAVFLTDDGTEVTELERQPCSAADIRTVEVWSTRLESGNTRAEFLLKSLRVRAARFFSYQAPKKSRFSWWYLAVGCQIALVVCLVVVLVRRRAS